MKQESFRSFLRRTLLTLLVFAGFGSGAWASEATLTFKITCNHPDALTFELTHASSSKTSEVLKPSVTWTKEGDNYICTISTNQYYTSGIFGIGGRKYSASLKATPAAGFAFYENNKVSTDAKTLYNGSSITSDVSQEYTVTVYPLASYTLKADPTYIASVTADWSAAPTQAASFSAAGSANTVCVTGDTYHVKVTPQTNAKYSVTVGVASKVADATDAQEFTLAADELAGAVVDVTAAFMPYYSRLTANAIGNGTVSVNGGGASALTEGTPKSATSDTHVYTLSAQPSEGCSFDGWFADEPCTERLSSDPIFDYTVNATSHDAATPTVHNVYARFSVSVIYYSQLTAIAAGAGNVYVGVTNEPGAYSSTSTASKNGEPTAASSEEHTYYLFAQADGSTNFMGWYTDEACTDKISEDVAISHIVTALSTAVTAPTAVTLYAKFEGKSEYNFYIKANDPEHFLSMKGGTADLEETLAYSVEGAVNTTTVAPNYSLQFNPASGISYTASLYDGDTFVRSLCGKANKSQTVVVSRDELAGKTVVVESQRGYNFTAKANPAHITAIIGGLEGDNETVAYSAEGTNNYTTYADAEYWMQVTPAGDNVIYSVKVYNEAGKHVSTPVHNATGTQAFTINRAHLQEGSVDVESVAVPEGGSYFTVKANPNHFSAMNGGEYASPQTFPDTGLKYSLDGEINIIANASKQYYIQIYGNDGVTYDAKRYNADGTTNNSLNGKTGISSMMVKNGCVVEFSSAAAGEEWSYTVIADPTAVQLIDKAVTPNVEIPCSTEGALYTTTSSGSKPEVIVPENYQWRAWFVPAGVALADKSDEHILRNWTAGKNDTYQYLDTRTWTLNDHDGGTLVIETYEKVANAKMTITVNGSASSVKASFGETEVKLSNGTNTVDIVDGKMLAISHATNTKKFYHLYMNGDEIAPREIAGEGGGAVTYMYNLGTPRDGDEVVIDVDYPAGPHAVSIIIPEGCESFIKSVTVDGTAQSDWQSGFSVAGGKTVAIKGDRYNYIVNGYTLYGADGVTVIKQGASAEPDYIVDQSVTFDFDLTKIERDKSFTLECASDASMLIVTNQKSVMSLAKGSTSTIAFNDDDNPITFNASYAGSSQNDVFGFWYVNNTLILTDNITLTRKVTDGETVKVEFSTKSKTLNEITYTINGLNIFPDVTVDGKVAMYGNHFADTDATITIKSTDDVLVTDVTVDGTALTPADGVFTFTVSADHNVVMTCTENIQLEERDKTVKMYISGLDNALKCDVTESTKSESLITSNDGQTTDGENIIMFRDSDLPLVLDLETLDSDNTSYVFLNNVRVADNGTPDQYTIESLNDGDVLAIYFDSKDGRTVTLNDDGWATVASRHALSVKSSQASPSESNRQKAASAISDEQFFVVTGTEDEDLLLKEISGAVAPGTGFLVHGEAGKTLLIPFAEEEEDMADTTGNMLQALFMGNEMTNTEGKAVYVYCTQEDGAAYWPVEDNYMSVDGDIAYITINENAAPSSLKIAISGITTGLSRVLTEGTDSVWSVSGIKMKSIAKPGMYIINGRKAMVK